ncbi:MAG: tRNA (adenosine(37)-N6)-threonylcarbamoyltransferase complex ATPase subunit type 1 TsaE [Gammaproteobacteria bacterium]|nr:tRNA (adenosine(37)-N6)-threonylcarbamoyltransferase complex ATPase subunit type 1 TsaE [Gammaproteobacteria bacterium]|tara:strand:- start:605 stop:1081 length:477 start_codon:yes stop_codon:yes gene_type:complete
MLKLELKNESKTLLLGSAIGNAIESLMNETIEVHINGNLGAGKTTLVRGILQYLNWKEVVTSPSYTLCEEYEINGRLLLHVDLYRINSGEDVEILNLDRETPHQKIIFIEWPENLQTSREADVLINLDHNKKERTASIDCNEIVIESSIRTYYETNKL